jgi:exonuclease VII large subunit
MDGQFLFRRNTMLNSVLIEGFASSIDQGAENASVVFKVRHSDALTVNATATGTLGNECHRYLKEGMKVRVIGKLVSDGLLVSYV